jgi:hypothetical protein
MCKKDGQTVDHLLLHCSVARALWSMVFSHCSFYELLAYWRRNFGRDGILLFEEK